MKDDRPNPLESLRAAADDAGIHLPEGLVEEILTLERNADPEDSGRSMTQHRLRAFLEQAARDAQ